jgi:cytochrome c
MVAAARATAAQRWLLLATVGLLSACQADPGGATSAAAPAQSVQASATLPFDAGPVKTAAEYLAEPAFAAADASRGELLGLACAACHHFRAEQGAFVGPNLQGVFGRAAGTVPGFAYSAALRESGLVWTPRSLEAWLADPAGFISGTTMAFAGYRNAEDRRDLIAYLLRATQ